VALGFVPMVVKNTRQTPSAPAIEADLGAIVVKMSGARIRIGANVAGLRAAQCGHRNGESDLCRIGWRRAARRRGLYVYH
jgi:hypothetical protein